MIFLICCFVFLVSSSDASFVNNHPIIGILAQEATGIYAKFGKSYIGASYVKYVESAGARVVPIRIGQTDKYYEDLFTQLNGLLLPGGNVDIRTSLYVKAIQKMFKMATKAYDKDGDVFPIWGTCLGFQALASQFSTKPILTKCNDEDVALSLTFEPGFRTSRIFSSIDNETLDILENENVTVNYHMNCLTPQTFKRMRLGGHLRVLTTNTDVNGIKYISTYEAIEYPFYGTQWHPEKNPFVWMTTKERRNIPHSYHAVLVSQYVANFFVNQARKSKHRFGNLKEEQRSLIYNYKVVNTVGKLSTMNQIYVFDY